MRIALNIVGGAIIALLALPFLLTIVTNGFFVTVTGSSMVPTYQPGDVLLVTRNIDATSLHVGDIVVINPSRMVAHYSDTSLQLGPYVHRIVDVESDGSYLTRGDGNQVDDPSPIIPGAINAAPTGIRLTGLGATLFTMTENIFFRLGMLVAGLFVFALAAMMRGKTRSTPLDHGDTLELPVVMSHA